MIRPACLAACLLLAPSGHAQTLEPEQVFERVSPSVWTIRTFDADRKSISQGSGVVIGEHAVITNCHVLARARYIVVMREKAQFLATLQWPDPERDLCQLRVPRLVAPAVAIGTADGLRIGQRVYAIGNPRGLELTMSEGIVSALRAGRQGQLIQTTAPISRGSSGGGLFNARGQLVGITTRIVTDGQNLNIAHPAAWIADVPERAKPVIERVRQQVPPIEHLTDALPAPVRAPTPAPPPAAAPSTVPPVGATGAPRPAPSATQPAALPAEYPRPGDTWTYAHIDLRFRPDDRSRRFVHTVRASSLEAITEEVTRGDLVIATPTHTRAIEASWRHNVLEVAPFLWSFKRPLAGDRIGKVPISGLQSVAVSSGEPALELRSGRVDDRERITVAAGSFDAVRVRIEGSAAQAWLNPNESARGQHQLVVTIWYAAAAKRAVRILVEAPGMREAYELESYRLGS